MEAMIKAGKLLVPVCVFYALKLVYDYLCDHKLLNYVRRDIIYFLSEWFLVGAVVLMMLKSSNYYVKVMSIAFSVVIVVRISLNLLCWNCTKEQYFNLVQNPIIDKIMWLPVAAILFAGILRKWQSHFKLGRYGRQ